MSETAQTPEPQEKGLRPLFERHRGKPTREELDRLIAELAGLVYRVAEDIPDSEPEGVDGGPWCETCRGARHLALRSDLPPREDPNFGKAVPCPACRAATAPIRESRIVAASGLSERQRSQTFDALRPTQGIQRALYAARVWADKPDGWLVIHGGVGSGKTHLGLAATNLILGRGDAVTWWYTNDLVKAAQRLMNEEGGGPQAFWDAQQAAAVLILDDLGAMRPSDYALDCMERMIDYRYRQRLATLFTCIGSPADLRRHFSESIGRRMQDVSVCKVVQNEAGQWEEKLPW